MFRTKTCGELRGANVGETVVLSGWVDSARDHSGVFFVNLRDRYGKTQTVFDAAADAALFESVKTLRNEDVVQITGEVIARPDGLVNPDMATGEIEVKAQKLVVLNRSEVVPFLPSAPEVPADELRLKYRYLDLRRAEMQRVLTLRHRIVKTMRDFFDENDFLEVETPILGKSTPEGARDYLVPSRVSQGSFYALPQSPQLYKQLLMIAGYDRYVQVARCFRDEDLRADRQPEFTQLDIEMSFIEMEDMIGLLDSLVARLMKEIKGVDIPLPLPRISYDEAMERFGHDAPDLRFGMELKDVTEIAKTVDFKVFRAVAESGGRVRGINVKNAADQFSRRDIDGLTTWTAEQFGAKGIVWFKVDADGKLTGTSAKNFSAEALEAIGAKLEAEPNDLLLFSCGDFTLTCRVLNGLRRRLAAQLKLYDPEEMNFCWVVNFPMFDWDEEENRWVATHHPFTAPLVEDLPKLDGDDDAIRSIRAQAYDLVLNGYEAGGGTIRIHDPAIQNKVFGLLGMTRETAKEQFGFLVDALQFGAPPHGGLALGLDRVVMLFAGVDNIRDCIAFPKTAKASDLMTGAPSEVAPKQLAELAIKSTVEPKTDEKADV
ncbi:MAG: aspartate--tRNA ligase [Thermoguttaceae bacterium]|nr:aspartate--tRNA ligase [Thermoguttaceae bacterium]MBR4102965.1 aspartate--tRNA ligase [Thermoguttaceae bacterium]